MAIRKILLPLQSTRGGVFSGKAQPHDCGTHQAVLHRLQTVIREGCSRPVREADPSRVWLWLRLTWCR